MWLAGAYITCVGIVAMNGANKTAVESPHNLKAENSFEAHQEAKNERAQFLKFMATYGKSYASSEQETDERFEIFRSNLAKINAHNELDAPFTLGVNQFSDLSEEEFQKRHQGVMLPQQKKKDRMYNRLFLASSPTEK